MNSASCESGMKSTTTSHPIEVSSLMLLEFDYYLNLSGRQDTGNLSVFAFFTASGLLPPAYVVRREGNVLTRVCPSIILSVHRGGYPYPIMLCNISQNAMGQPGGGYPARFSRGGTLAWGVPWPGGYPGQGGYPGREGGYPVRTT